MMPHGQNNDIADGYVCVPFGSDPLGLPDLETQAADLRAYARDQCLDLTRVYREMSGSPYLRDRPELLKLLKPDARRARAVVFWSRRTISTNLFFALWIEKEFARRRIRLCYVNTEDDHAPLNKIVTCVKDYFLMLEMDFDDHLAGTASGAPVAESSDVLKAYEFKRAPCTQMDVMAAFQGRSLTYNGVDLWDLQRLVHSPMMVQEFVLVLEGQKPAARLLMHEAHLDSVLKFCGMQRLHTGVVEMKLVDAASHSSESAGSLAGSDQSRPMSLRGVAVERQNSKSGFAIVFVSRDPNLPARAAEAERTAGAREIGSLLGYPPCCVEAFCRGDTGSMAINGRPRPGSGTLLTTLSFRQNYFLLDELCLGIVNYIPCSLNCERTEDSTLGYWRSLLSVLPDYARFLKEQLTGLVILAGTRGCFFARNCTVNRDSVSFDTITALSEFDPRLEQQLSQCRCIANSSREQYRIGDFALSQNEMTLLNYVADDRASQCGTS